jgi:hypothetical protein
VFLSESKFSKATFLFTSSTTRLKYIQKLIRNEGVQLIEQLPPVAVPIWRRRPLSVRYPYVHIGNKKKSLSDGLDPLAEAFSTNLKANSTHVWGHGWKESKFETHNHGNARLCKVSSLYSRSQFAFGFMYPHQRNATISGRFWQAPLAGCYLISEFVPDSYYPGVVVESPSPPPTLQMRRQLADVAAAFWSKHFELCIGQLRPLVPNKSLREAALKPPSRATLLLLFARRWFQVLKWGVVTFSK